MILLSPLWVSSGWRQVWHRVTGQQLVGGGSNGGQGLGVGGGGGGAELRTPNPVQGAAVLLTHSRQSQSTGRRRQEHRNRQS